MVDNSLTEQRGQVISNEMKRFADILSICNASHIKNCRCYETEVSERLHLEWPEVFSQLCEEGYGDNSQVISSRKEGLLNSIINEIGSKNAEKLIRCPLEAKSVERSFTMFLDSHYDMSNPVVFGIVRKALEQELFAFRMSMRVDADSMLVWHDRGEKGGEYVLNPLVDANRRASDFVLKASEVLSRIVDGTLSKQITVDLDASRVFDRKEMYGDSDEVIEVKRSYSDTSDNEEDIEWT